MSLSMQGFTVPGNKRKYLIILFLSLCGFLALFDFYTKTNSFSSDSGWVLLFIFYIIIHYLIFVPICLWRLFSSKPELVINSLGIYCRSGSNLPNQVVRWELFESYNLQKNSGTDFIELRLKDKEVFLNQFPSHQRAVKMGLGAAIFPLGLFPKKFRVDQQELIRHLSQWLPYREPDLELDLDVDLGDNVKK